MPHQEIRRSGLALPDDHLGIPLNTTVFVQPSSLVASWYAEGHPTSFSPLARRRDSDTFRSLRADADDLTLNLTEYDA
jgi:hypothetical protein